MTDPTPQAPALLLTVREAAAALTISERTLHRLAKRGDLVAVRIGGCTRFDPRDLAALIERLKAAPVEATP